MPVPDVSLQEPRALRLAGPLGGSLRPPGSKSLAQRALLAAAMASGPCELHGLPEGDDVLACLCMLEALGVRLESGEVCRVEGLAGKLSHPEAPIQFGESGTLARLGSALLALHGPARRIELEATGSLRARRSEPLLASLSSAGARLDRAPGARGSWPLSVLATRTFAALELNNPVSSQEVSALWLAAAVDPHGHEVSVHGHIPSRPYLDLTEQILACFGAELCQQQSDGDLLRVRIQGPLVSPGSLQIEADASSAAVALAAACLSGGELRVHGLPQNSVQGDLAMLDYLEQFGCRVERRGDALWAAGLPTRSASLELGAQPDLAPPLAIIAAAAAESSGEECVLGGLATLRGKESDRLALLARGLASAGWRVEIRGDQLRIAPAPAPTPAGLVLDSAGDHRMAFAFALLGILRPGILVRDPGCVAKSWPGFWEAIEASACVQ